MEFWINASDGSPYFFVTAEVNEKMGKMLLEENPKEPLFTLVFDREAYSLSLFAQLWNTCRIAVINYRKNVKDQWDESLFTDHKVATSLGEVEMKLHKQSFSHNEWNTIISRTG